MTKIWRLNLKTAAKNGVDPRKFCLERNILGVGWKVEKTGSVTWDDYIAEASLKYKSKGRSFSVAIKALKSRMQINDLCWTRDHDGSYYLGRITSDWRYESTQEYHEADVVNVRSCEWRRVGTVDVVPGRILNSYISGSTVQKVNGTNVSRYSKFLANRHFKDNHYKLGEPASDLLSLLSSEDFEDIAALYMQKAHGFMVITSSCKLDTAAYECVMKHPDSGRKAFAQVKHGKIDLNRDKYRNLDGEIFLLTTMGHYLGAEAKNIHCLAPDEIIAFAKEHRILMSDRVQNWIDFDENPSV